MRARQPCPTALLPTTTMTSPVCATKNGRPSTKALTSNPCSASFRISKPGQGLDAIRPSPAHVVGGFVEAIHDDQDDLAVVADQIWIVFDVSPFEACYFALLRDVKRRRRARGLTWHSEAPRLCQPLPTCQSAASVCSDAPWYPTATIAVPSALAPLIVVAW